MKTLTFIPLLLLLGLVLNGCISQPATADDLVVAEAAVVSALPTLAKLAPSLTPTVAQSFTPIPTSTATAVATATLPPTWTPTPSPPIASASAGLPCPETSPGKPQYTRFVLGEKPWPTPQSNPAAHFWLDKPLPGGGRYLFNTTFPYGYDSDGAYLLHNGVDTGATLGTPLLAVGDGTVVVAQADEEELYGWRCDWYGHLVVIELDQRWQNRPVYALYGHVLNIKVEEGQRVRTGEEVAEVGVGGAAIVPHLHFEVRVGANEFGATQNPMLWVRPPETRGLIVGRLLDPTGRPWQGVWVSAIHNEERTESVTWSYLDDPQHLINPDSGFAENFVLTDLLPGRYTLATKIQGVDYRTEVEVQGGEMTRVEIITEPYKTVTPAATDSPELTPTP